MKYQQVKTEYCPASEVGCAGGDVRIIARSASHLMVYHYGEIIATRGDLRRVSRMDANDVFGEGFGDFVKANSKRGFGTTLVDGGGKKPYMARKDVLKQFRQNEADTSATLPQPDYKKCHVCGGDLKPNHQYHHGFAPLPLGVLLKQTNSHIIAADTNFNNLVTSYHSWEPSDGYRDSVFCSKSCKIAYAVECATKAGLYD